MNVAFITGLIAQVLATFVLLAATRFDGKHYWRPVCFCLTAGLACGVVAAVVGGLVWMAMR